MLRIDQPPSQEIKIAQYNPGDQIDVSDLDSLYPEWKTEHPYADSELLLFDYVRTQEESRIGSELRMPPEWATKGLENAIEQIPDEVGSQFQAHGIAGKSGSSSAELDMLLKNGIDKSKNFYTRSLQHNTHSGGALGADIPFTQGGIVTVMGRGDIYSDGGIKYVIIGEQYLKCFDVMKNRFSGVTLIPWHDAPQFFCNLVNEQDKTSYIPNTVENADVYEETMQIYDHKTLELNVSGVISHDVEVDYDNIENTW